MAWQATHLTVVDVTEQHYTDEQLCKLWGIDNVAELNARRDALRLRGLTDDQIERGIQAITTLALGAALEVLPDGAFHKA